MIIALAGNPNSGKTTMFNVLTGKNEKVGNWAGVTVDKKQGNIKKSFTGGKDILAVDLPGAYSMSPFTNEESVTSEYVKNAGPDVIINIVDATNLSRSLFFTTQLLELGIPVVVALNKSDINEKKLVEIDDKKLSEKLGCSVIKTNSSDSDNSDLHNLIEKAILVFGESQTAPYMQGDIDLSDRSAVLSADKKRFDFVNSVVSEVEKRKVRTNERKFGDKIDEVLTNKWFGIPIFALVMFLVFYISQSTLGTWIAEGYEFENGMAIPGLITFIGMFQEWVASLFVNANPLITALLVDGVIGGVAAVLGFLPLVMIMYFLIALLEDCGYMSRVAVVLDPIFKRVGLSGKSVIPFVMSVGCAVPGVMASRTIKDERERRAAAMLAPFMPCGAKIPVISLFAGAFFGNAGWVSALMYLVGIVIIFLGALLINGITGTRVKKSYFIIELSDYKVPSIFGAFKSMCSRGKEYIIKAATIILLCNTLVQIMQTFDLSFSLSESADTSILATVARPFAYLLVPIVGVLSWQLAAAAVTGFIAKENVVGTLAVCFVGLENLIDAEELQVLEGAGAEVAGVMAISKAAAPAYLMFNLYSPPCFAAIGAMNAEMKSSKWLFGGIGLQLAVGYTIAFLVYQFGTLISEGHLGEGFLAGAVAIIIMVGIVTFLCIRGGKNKAQKV